MISLHVLGESSAQKVDSRRCSCSSLSQANLSLGVSRLVGKFPGSSRECAQEITRKRVGRARGSGAGETGRGIADRGSHRNRPV